MLKKVSVLITGFHKSSNLAHSYQLELLAKKLEKQNKQLLVCEEFKKTKKLPQYFKQKTTDNFNLEDAYFYLVNRQKFTYPKMEVYESMIRSVELDCLSRFVIADQTKSIQDESIQIVLMGYFNKSCLEMDLVDFIQCLKIIRKFDRLVRMNDISYDKVKLRIKNEEKNISLSYLEILYYFNEIGMLDKVIDKHSAKAHLIKFSEQINKLVIGIKHLYYLDVLEEQLGIQPTQAALINREKLLSNRITGAKTEEELEYSIKTFNKYIQFIYLLHIDKLNCRLYKIYLNHIKKCASQNQNFFITTHPLPNKVIQTATVKQFKQIIQLRVELQLNKIEELGKLVKKIVEHNTEALLGLLQYLVDEDISDFRLWVDLQSGFIDKLNLNSKNWSLGKLSQQVDIQVILKILGYMSINKLGSVSFWKPCQRLTFNIVMDETCLSKIDQSQMKKVIPSIYEIFQFQTMPEALQSKLKDLTVISLVNQDWELRDLYKLIKCLTFSKYICAEIWYAIESKLLVMTNHGASTNQKITLAMILQYATQMNVGSFKFYEHMKKIEVNKVKIRESPQKVQKNQVKQYDLVQN